MELFEVKKGSSFSERLRITAIRILFAAEVVIAYHELAFMKTMCWSLQLGKV